MRHSSSEHQSKRQKTREQITMVGFTWIKMSLFLILVLLFTATTGQVSYIYIDVRDGDDVTLSCENLINDQDKCDGTTWIFSGSGNTAAVELVRLGQIQSEAKSKPDRLSVTENCSLVLKKVTVEDVGRYTCRQFDTSRQHHDTMVFLSVVTMTEQKLRDKVTFSCQVSTYDQCGSTVKWVYQDKEVKSTSQRSCSDNVTFPTSDVDQNSKFYESLKCKVTYPVSGEVQQFIFRRQSSGWWYIVVPVVLVSFICSVLFVMWRKIKGRKPEMDDNTGSGGCYEVSYSTKAGSSAPAGGSTVDIYEKIQ